MFIVIFSILVSGVILFTKLKDVKPLRENVKQALENNKFEKYDFSTWVKVIYIVFILGSIVALGYGFIIKDFDIVSIGIILIFIFVSELIMLPYRMVLYYNETHFIACGKVVRYKSIKTYEELKYVSFGFVRIVTLSDEKIPLSRKALAIVQEKRDQLKKKK